MVRPGSRELSQTPLSGGTLSEIMPNRALGQMRRLSSTHVSKASEFRMLVREIIKFGTGEPTNGVWAFERPEGAR